MKPRHREEYAEDNEDEGDTEFSFWNPSNTMSSYMSDSKNMMKVVECSPFLPRSRRCSRIMDPSKIKAIEEGRKELMEMVQGMPDSSFELSFQDMVVHDKQVLQSEPYQDEENKHKQVRSSSSSSSNSSGKAQAKKPKKAKKSESINRPKQMMRVESMDSASFLLKLFIPISLKKPKVQNGSKNWSVKSSSSSSGGSGDKSRYFDRNLSFSQGCLPFSHYIKGIKKKVGG
ncbi:hypothetical protein HN51_059475 [Arachis hypogaea]|uniref:Uncharacterized protein n=1 Tax=Arachis hypogaea TaxID=3818 RepID=A0A444X5S6_ARAHY|nr:uncharacterized protein LOC107624473 [Arachis ipaensis]XP_025684252.1 uncharacterized protein LOC112785060 [Arachis hypogaea]QHN82883.1 uncharacterized protein DS421_20g699690 [Arachis hypogaea]RYQ85024.1 hypothetical protein Ahy_B10g104505 [Arachis hypogaea]